MDELRGLYLTMGWQYDVMAYKLPLYMCAILALRNCLESNHR